MHTPRNIQAPHDADDFWAQHGSVNPRFCTLIKVTPKSFWTGVSPLGFTSNTRNMTMPGHPGVTFKASPAITPTIIESSLDEPSNLELTGVYNSDSFDREDVLAGKYEFAEIEVFTACWDNVDLGEFLHFRGNLGEFKDYETYFTAECRGLLTRLSNDVNIVTSRFCRVKEFRDAQCGHTAATVTIDAVVYDVEQTAVVGQVGTSIGQLIFDTSTWAGTNPPPNQLYSNGKITAMSGDNAGVSREIAGISEATGGYPFINVWLKREFPFAFSGGEAFDFVAGCDRTLENCMLYENVINRRAEDFIPGLESANRIPAAN